MTAAEIKEYLGMVVELEKEVYTQNGVIASLEYKLVCMPGYHQYEKPVYTKPCRPDNFDDTAGMVAFMCLPSAVVLVLLGFIIYFFDEVFFFACQLGVCYWNNCTHYLWVTEDGSLESC